MAPKSGEAPATSGVGLTGRQRALVEALGDRTELITFYLGARRVLEDESNPDRLAQAAHSVRELLEKSPKYFDVPGPKGGSNLKSEAKNLDAAWARALKNSHCLDDGKWSGEIDGSLRKFLGKAKKFFEWLNDERPPRVEEARGFLRRTDRGPYPLPDRIESLRLQEWDEYREFFVAAAHHGGVTAEDLDRWIASFEDFLLKQLAPPTFEDRGEIRRIVAEAEGRADS